MTLNNAVEEEYRVWIVFFFTEVYSLMGHLLIYFFENQRKILTQTNNTDPTELTEVEISHHAIMLKGINRSIPYETA